MEHGLYNVSELTASDGTCGFNTINLFDWRFVGQFWTTSGFPVIEGIKRKTKLALSTNRLTEDLHVGAMRQVAFGVKQALVQSTVVQLD